MVVSGALPDNSNVTCDAPPDAGGAAMGIPAEGRQQVGASGLMYTVTLKPEVPSGPSNGVESMAQTLLKRSRLGRGMSEALGEDEDESMLE